MIQTYKISYNSDSSTYFSKLRVLGNAVYLDSNSSAEKADRFDIISAKPNAKISLKKPDPSIAWQQLKDFLNTHQINTESNPDFPFQGGVIGQFSYTFAEAETSSEFDYPCMELALYLWALIVDHKKQRCTLVYQDRLTAEQLSEIKELLQNPCPEPNDFQLQQAWQANMDIDTYKQMFTKIQEYIQAGDCYQVNLAQRFNSLYQGDPWSAYLQLRAIAPVSYGAYLENDQGAILSLSPEQFISLKQGLVLTKPIKGTIARGNNPEQDKEQKNRLLNSSKDRAENLMIVDLLRNDLSKVCALHSVKVPQLCALESYANVHHLVSTVTGQLDKQYDAIDLLQACFPGGSITGAPKKRAMEIIAELEPNSRSIYCGSIGYISFCGAMDTNISIRTLLCHKDQIHCWGGGGIVGDSKLELEYEESQTKVQNLLQKLAENINTKN